MRPVASLDELAASVDLADISHGAARFDEAELGALSARMLHHLPFAAVRDGLRRSESPGRCRTVLDRVRGNLARLDEAAIWRR